MLGESVWIGENDSLDVVRAMFEEYQRELDIDLCFQGFPEELADPLAKYGPPRGAILLVRDGEDTVACGALWGQEPGVAELKRIYVRPAYRGRGLGEYVTIALIERARQLGYRLVRLDTLRRLGPANELYKKLGFRETEAYNFNPEPDIAYFEIDLEGTT